MKTPWSAGAVRKWLRRAPGGGTGGESNGTLRRVLGYLLSGALTAALIGIGMYVLPFGAHRGGVAHFMAPPGQLYTGEAGTLPVFVMRPDRSVIRHGVARPTTSGLLRAEFYSTPLPAFERTTQALLVEPGLTVLWVAADPADRQRLFRRIEAVQNEVGRTIERVVGSAAFDGTYKPRLRQVLNDAVQDAWRDRRAQAEVDLLLDQAAPVVREALAGQAGDVLRQHLNRAVWEMLKANWRHAFGAVLGGELDYAPVNDALVEASRDPRLRQAAAALGSRLLDLPASERLSERLAVALMDRLVRDGRLARILADMAGDQRLIDEVRPLSRALYELAGAVPSNLAGLGNENALSPLVAHVFKSLGLSSRSDFILFVTPSDEARFAAEARDAYRALRRVELREEPAS